MKQSSSVLAGSALTAAISARAHAAGDEMLKVALVGCGFRGTGAAAQAVSTAGPVKLWAMADVFDNKIEISHKNLLTGLKERYDRTPHGGYGDNMDVSPQRRFVGFDAYKKAIDSGVDVVILATQPHFRPEHYEYAVKQDKHVFMEKPVATDATGIRRLLAANELAKKKNLKVVCGLQRHHLAIYQETMKRIKDGAIGDITLLRCYWNSSAGGIVPRRPKDMSEMEHQLRHPYCFTWLSGDHIVEQHIHNIDICNWVKDTHPVEANGMGGRQFRNGRDNGEIFDHHAVEFTYADGTKMFSQCRHNPGCANSVSEHALGTKGSAEINRGRITGPNKWRFRGKSSNPYQIEHDVLFDAIRNNKPHNEAEYAAISTMTAIMGRMATYSGKVIKWDQALNSSISLSPERYAWAAKPPVVADAAGVYPCAIPGVTKVI
ncbi:MAG: Gfo/Idh/MocA family oxidoreductase [Planctomycetota bacterium]|nr:Gfo/Idh/MocA family oxidoreductase [Planctomycetota bacterium]